MNQQKTSLVTGGAGFIGSHVTDHLIKMGHKVIVLDDLSGGFKDNVSQEAAFVPGSINDLDLLTKLFTENNFDYVYHLAAYAAEGLSHFIRRFNYENNLIGSMNLINLSVNYNVKHFIFTSSIAVYGTNQLPMQEELTPLPEDPYGIAKQAVELDIKAAHKMFGLNYTVFRPHNVYGERQNCGDPYRNVLGIFINNILLNKSLTIFGDGKQTRAFSHIDDVAPHIANCVNVEKAKNEIFNIGADKPYTVLALAELIASAMGVEQKIDFLPFRNEVVHAYCDHAKVNKTFNIKETVALKEGILRMVSWAKDKGARKTKKFTNIEVSKNMPSIWKNF